MFLKRLVKSILSFVLLTGSAIAQAPSTPTGDPGVGRALFVGERPFARGGPPCGACHGLAGQGPAFEASFGPDLSTTYETLGADALDATLTDIPYPSMVPVFAGRALDPDERAHLVAFLRAAGGRAPTRGASTFALQGLGLAALALALLALAGRRRIGSVRAQLLSQHGGGR